MAAPMLRVTNANPDTRYPCPRCGNPVPLAGYRLLYGGRCRALRCRACEIATASPAMARYYAGQFEAKQEAKRRYHQTHPDIQVASRARYRARHAQDDKEYKQGWYLLHRDEQSRKASERHTRCREEQNRRANERYAALHRTPEAVAVRTAARAQRLAADRAAWRARILDAAANLYSAPPDILQAEDLRHLQRGCSAHDEACREARRLALYLIHAARRSRDRHPLEELAEEFHTSPRGIRVTIGQTAAQLRRRRTCDDGTDLYAMLTQLCADLAFHCRGLAIRLVRPTRPTATAPARRAA